jgi:hypothetical protein
MSTNGESTSSGRSAVMGMSQIMRAELIVRKVRSCDVLERSSGPVHATGIFLIRCFR